MASAVPYDPEGFGAESNPFAQEETSPESQPETNESTGANERSEGSEHVEQTGEPSDSAPVAAPAKPVKKYKLVLKVTGLERQGKKDPIFRFDAYVSSFGLNCLFFH